MQEDFLRYSCQMLLPGFSQATQEKLQQSKVLIVGAGGLGCPAAQYLAAAGVGTIGIADFDVVSVSNLHRQVLYSAAEAGMPKVEIACRKLSMQNPSIQLLPHQFRITSENVMSLLEIYDIVVDGTDNFETRYLLNDACVLTGKPLVYGGIYQFEGQVAVWNMKNDDDSRTPNYRDLFPSVDAAAVPNCAEGGVLPTIAGLIGCMQANEVLKILTGTGEVLAGKILIINALTLQSRIIKTGRRSRVSIRALTPTVDIPAIDARELQVYLQHKNCELVDVRNDDERSAFNIGGRHIPLPLLKDSAASLPVEKTLVFYCASGKRSEEAVKIMKEKYPAMRAYSLKGGMKAWREHLAQG
jgi:sulfur-carrier protein adenylyltransferase/sulfurtransferase